MKITKHQLIRIINEELAMVNEQNIPRPMPSVASTMIPDEETTIDDDTDWYNILLDLAGLIPGYGEIFDAINAVDYIRKGNYLFAALSAISIIPTIGDALGKGGKLAILLAKMGKAGKYIGRGADFVSANKGTIKKASDWGRDLKHTVRANKGSTDAVFDYIATTTKNDDIKQSVPQMKQALDAFAGSRTAAADDVIPPMASWSGEVAMSECFNRDRLVLLSGITEEE
jgi:hypothetical protein